jgi:type I restriction enzyme, S subunit
MNYENTNHKLISLIQSVSETFKFQENIKVVLINTSDILDGKVLKHETEYPIKIAGQFKKAFKKNDILFSEIRPANKRFAFVDFDSNIYVASTKLMVLRRKSDLIDNRFLYQFLKSDEVLNKLQSIAESRSGTFPQITFTELSNLEIKLPPLNQQILVADFLQRIDNKIEINNKINKNLEKLVQTLYKSWSVDFEFPNEEGKPYKSSGGEMVDSELGLIPKGWRLETLGNSSISSLIKTGVSKFEGTKTYIATADVSGIDIVSFKTKITLEDKPSRANMQPVSNSLWFAKMKNSRKLIRVSSTSRYLLNRCIFSTGFAGLLVPDYPNYIWSFLISKEFDDMKNNLSNGTTMEGINNDGINRIKIIIPKKEILSKFENTINSFYEEIQFLQIQNNKLADLRDLLLPKLMSGEIEVPDME